jgi:hypothetical protein
VPVRRKLEPDHKNCPWLRERASTFEICRENLLMASIQATRDGHNRYLAADPLAGGATIWRQGRPHMPPAATRRRPGAMMRVVVAPKITAGSSS